MCTWGSAAGLLVLQILVDKHKRYLCESGVKNWLSIETLLLDCWLFSILTGHRTTTHTDWPKRGNRPRGRRLKRRRGFVCVVTLCHRQIANKKTSRLVVEAFATWSSRYRVVLSSWNNFVMLGVLVALRMPQLLHLRILVNELDLAS